MNTDALVIALGVFTVMLALVFWITLRRTCVHCHAAVYGVQDERGNWWCEACGGPIV